MRCSNGGKRELVDEIEIQEEMMRMEPMFVL